MELWHHARGNIASLRRGRRITYRDVDSAAGLRAGYTASLARGAERCKGLQASIATALKLGLSVDDVVLPKATRRGSDRQEIAGGAWRMDWRPLMDEVVDHLNATNRTIDDSNELIQFFEIFDRPDGDQIQPMLVGRRSALCIGAGVATPEDLDAIFHRSNRDHMAKVAESHRAALESNEMEIADRKTIVFLPGDTALKSRIRICSFTRLLCAVHFEGERALLHFSQINGWSEAAPRANHPLVLSPPDGPALLSAEDFALS